MIYKMNKTEQKIKQMQEVIDNQEKMIVMLSDKKIVQGLNSALEDVKAGNYTILTN